MNRITWIACMRWISIAANVPQTCEGKDLEAQKIVEAYKLQLQQPPVIRSGRWKCMLCGRYKFTHKSPHKCVGGFRKRKIVWQEVESHCL